MEELLYTKDDLEQAFEAGRQISYNSSQDPLPPYDYDNFEEYFQNQFME